MYDDIEAVSMTDRTAMQKSMQALADRAKRCINVRLLKGHTVYIYNKNKRTTKQ